MNDNDKSTVWIGAFRYYCGRMTYAVSDFCEALIREWPSLPGHAKQIIQRDLEEEFQRDDLSRQREDGDMYFRPLGHDCDRAQWEKVRALWPCARKGEGA